MKLRDYIKANFKTQREFAKHMETTPQHITVWLRNEYIVIDHVIYRPIKKVTGAKL